MALIVRADGTTEPLRAKTATRAKLTLKQLQEAVGGYIEIVAHEKGLLVCNEEGLLRKLPQNKRFPMFVGDVVICSRTEIEV